MIRRLGSMHLMERGSTCFPPELRDGGLGTRPNLTRSAAARLAALGGDAAALFHHVVAILHAPAYEAENADGLRQDWPRLPLPAEPEALAASAALGRRVAALLDVETAVAGVTAGPIRPELLALGALWTAGAAPDLRVAAGWGHAGPNGIAMPGRGDARPRAYTAAERDALAAGAAALGVDPAAVPAVLGEGCVDVMLNPAAAWRCVPMGVWRYALGGYAVIKKWLSYRELDRLGRPLTPAEAESVTAMIRRIAALRLLEPVLDANYRAVAATALPWPADARCPEHGFRID